MDNLPRSIIRKIRITSAKKFNTQFSGQYRSAFKGFGLLFDGVREYQAGDDVKSIDWNVSARMNHLFVKEYTEERELSIVLMMDISGSMDFGVVQTKREAMLETAAVILQCASLNGDRVSVLLFSDHVEKYFSPKKGSKYLLKTLNDICEWKPEARKTDICKASDFLLKVLKKRSVIFLLSDFIDEGYLARMKMLSRRHEIIPVRIVDSFEKGMKVFGLAAFSDLETGMTVYADAIPSDSKTLDIDGYDILTISTDEPAASAVLAFFKNEIKRSFHGGDMRKIWYIALLCVSAFVVPASAAPDVKALVSSKEIAVGDPVEFIVSVSATEKDPVIVIPEQRKYYAEDISALDKKKKSETEKPQDKLPIFVIDAADIQDLSTNESVHKTLKLKVLYFVPGQYVMPPVIVKGADNSVSIFEYPSVVVKAVNEQGESADIEPPLVLNGNYYRVILLVLTAVILGAAGYAVFLFFKKKNNSAVTEIPVPAIVFFREELFLLKKILVDEKISPEEFAQKISAAFRKLISGIYSFDAEEMTSKEILSHIVSSRKGLTSERYGESLERIMNLWDMTKFAEFNPSKELLSANLDETSSLAEKMWRDNGGI